MLNLPPPPHFHSKVIVKRLLFFTYGWAFTVVAFGQSTEPTWSNSGFSTSTPNPYSFRMGNVMIGSGNNTTGAKLYVYGGGNTAKDLIVTGRIQSGDGSGNGGLWVGNDDKTFVGRNGANLGFYNNGAWRFLVDASGNIGIGTAPTAQLQLADIYGAGGKNLQIGDDTYFSDIDVGGVLGLYSATSAQPGLKLGGSGPTIYGGNNGFLGIGTSTPSQMLEVAGSIKANSIVFPDGSTLSSASLTGGSTSFSSGISITNDNSAYLQISTTSSARGIVAISPYANGYASNSKANDFVIGTVEYRTSNGDLYLVSGAAGRSIKFGTRPTGGNWTNIVMEIKQDGAIYGKKIIVTQIGWPDYVFEKDHQIMSLEETENYIQTNKKLPGIPSAKEVEEKGIDTGEMLKLQMEKIEELTLHLIAQQKEIETLKKSIK